MKFNVNVTLMIVGTLVLAGGLYWYFTATATPEAPLTADGGNNEAQLQFQGLISQLPSSFDTTIFTNPNFTGLVDITTPVAPENAGRIDPFASLK